MHLYAGIFLVAGATLLLEISLTRIFSVLYFHHFAFLIISTALFGYGFSGIFLLLKKQSTTDLPRRLSIASLLFAASLLLVYKLILILPYGFTAFKNQPIQIVRLLFNYAALTIPFFFSGYIISSLLAHLTEQSGKLYSFDLLGAASGCLIVLWIVPMLGGSGTVVMSSAIAGCAALIFAPSGSRLRWIAVLAIAAATFLTWRAEQYFAIPIKKVIEEKYPLRKMPNVFPEFSGWSPVSRIDVLPLAPNRLMLLDGGSNVSFMIPFDGNTGALQPRWNWRAVPYAFGSRTEACIIGPGGGEDVLLALSHQTGKITAVEMDPLIVSLVQGKYKRFIGGIFDHPSVMTLNDEGRSYLRRSNKQFDLIQQVHNISPMAIATGALNLSESYLLTLEAFREYWHHLKPDGVLAINRWGILRAASVASATLQKEKIPDPENYVVVTSRYKSGADTSFFLKKGRISPEDLTALQAKATEMRIQIDYAPLTRFQKPENIYYSLLQPSLRKEFLKKADLILDAPTDDQPFFDHMQRFGSFQTSTAILPKELNPVLQYLNLGDLALFTLLAEAVILSSLFIIFPLVRLKHQENISRWSVLAFFTALGLGFILIEISLIQKHILFLGQPVYSISSVLFSLLLTAGLGSYIFQKLFRAGSERRWLLFLSLSFSALIIFEIAVAPKIFQQFLGSPKPLRFILSGLIIAPLGIVLGIPFPFGIRILGSKSPGSVAWAWALNAYATVIGSILCVILAITWGFNLNLLFAWLIYLLGFFFFYRTFGLGQEISNA